MKNKNNFISTGIEKIKDSYVNIDPVKFIQTLKAFSKVFFIFALMFLGAFIFKLFKIDDEAIKHFKLILSDIDILPLYKTSLVTFTFISLYEILKISLVAVTFYYFIKFLNSIDINEPFKNIKSKSNLSAVAVLSIVFFSVDAISMMHLAYFQEWLQTEGSIRIFHFEYLFLAYFINVFAVIFKRGVDLNNEIDLVI